MSFIADAGDAISKYGLVSNQAEDCLGCYARTIASDGPRWCFWGWWSTLLPST